MLSEHITRAKETRDDLPDKSQNELRKLQDIRTEYETIKSKVEEYKEKYPLIAYNKELEKELDEIHEECENHMHIINSKKRELSEVRLDYLRLRGTNVEKDCQLKARNHQLSVCWEKVKELENELAKNHEREKSSENKQSKLSIGD